MINTLRIMMIAAAACLVLGAVASADPLPDGWKASNLQPLGYAAVQGPRLFKLTVKKVGPKW